jgi:cytidyltransferase-like protein
MRVCVYVRPRPCAAHGRARSDRPRAACLQRSCPTTSSTAEAWCDSPPGATQRSDVLGPTPSPWPLLTFPPPPCMRVFARRGSGQPEQRVVYVDGAFDLFRRCPPWHSMSLDALDRRSPGRTDVGHIEFLKHARALGHYVVVGVHEDEAVNRVKGSNNPIMALHERVLGVLSCRVRRLAPLRPTAPRGSLMAPCRLPVRGPCGDWRAVHGDRGVPGCTGPHRRGRARVGRRRPRL